MTIWPPKKGELKRPAYHSLATRVIEAIEAGELTDGARLPPHRTLAYDLGVSVQTVSRAYEELRRLGIVTGQVGRGSFVRSSGTDARMPWQRSTAGDGVIDCSMLVPVSAEIHAERMSATLAELAKQPPHETLFSFRPRATFERHCHVARTWIAGCGIDAEVERILPTNGSTAAMSVALMTAAMPGDLVATEEIGHHTLKSLTGTLGQRLTGIAIDEQGIRPDAFERACMTSAVKILFLLPSALNPTAAMMGAERRRQIAEIARKHDVWIIENDAWGPLEPDRPAPIAAIAPERTFYFTGMTKCMLPGLRVAWLVVPEQMIAAARTRHLVTHWMATPMMAEIASRWIEDGTAGELLRWQREKLGARIRVARARLGDIPHSATEHGMHLWLHLPEPWREDAFVAHARNDGVAVAAGANFLISDMPRPPSIRVCIGAGSEDDIAKGLNVIARLLRSTPEPALLAI